MAETQDGTSGMRWLTPLLVIQVVSVLLLIAILVIVVGSGGAPKMANRDPKILREEAQKLAREKLYRQAVESYEAYLREADLTPSRRANIHFLVADIYHNKLQDYENALAAYYRVRLNNPESSISAKVDRGITACLEALDRSGDARRERRQAVSLSPEKEPTPVAEGAVVAKIGDREITMGELDVRIAELPPYARQGYESPGKKLEFLRDYITTELLYEAAKRSNYDQDPQIVSRAFQVKKQLMAQKVYEEKVQGAVEIKPEDVELYFKAHESDYLEPAKAEIAHILLDDEDAAEKALERLKGGEDFATLAKKLSQDETTKNEGGRLGTVSKGQEYVPGVGSASAIVEAAFETEANQIHPETIKGSKGYHVVKVFSRTPERQKTFEEVGQQVAAALQRERTEKEAEAYLKQLESAQRVQVFEDLFEEDKKQKE